MALSMCSGFLWKQHIFCVLWDPGGVWPPTGWAGTDAWTKDLQNGPNQWVPFCESNPFCSVVWETAPFHCLCLFWIPWTTYDEFFFPPLRPDEKPTLFYKICIFPTLNDDSALKKKFPFSSFFFFFFSLVQAYVPNRVAEAPSPDLRLWPFPPHY